MARLIEADAVKRLIKNFGKGAISDGQKTLDPVDDIILLSGGVDYIPTVDAVEVVRCKDCHNCTKSKWCNLLMMNVKDDGFCSYGKRRGADI